MIASISTETPIFENITDKIPTIIEKIIKIVTGWGRWFDIAIIFPIIPFLSFIKIPPLNILIYKIKYYIYLYYIPKWKIYYNYKSFL